MTKNLLLDAAILLGLAILGVIGYKLAPLLSPKADIALAAVELRSRSASLRGDAPQRDSDRVRDRTATDSGTQAVEAARHCSWVARCARSKSISPART
jgi:hypothetical protein